jgi:hypothetical protein
MKKIFKYKSNKDIVFTNINEKLYSNAYLPKPSSEYLPEWYKKTKTYLTNQLDISLIDNNPPMTIKKCTPVFDALTSGYILVTPCDLVVKKNDNGDILYLTSIPNQVQLHGIQQAPYHPYMNQHDYPKWINQWGIKTPPGYSCLFIPPVHGGNEFFTIAEGIVDTDTYNASINFPFILNDVNFEGLIPAGTPMVQIIPIKRDDWKMSLGSKKDLDNLEVIKATLSVKYFNKYKSLFWHKKSYR